MGQYFFQFLIPVASIATIGALVLTFHALRTSKTMAVHELHEQQRFDYSKEALLSLEGNVNALQTTVSKTLVPDVHAVYEHLLKGGADIRATGLVEILKRVGYKDVFPLTDNNLHVFMGVQHEGLHISFLIGFDDFADFVVNSFAYYILQFNESVAEQLLDLNATNKIGTIGLRIADDKKVLAITHAMRLPSGRIDPDDINQIILRLAVVHSMARRVLDDAGIERHELLIGNFLKLKFPPPAQVIAAAVEGLKTPAYAG